jgi:xanthine dehydrogenase accessory factor
MPHTLTQLQNALAIEPAVLVLVLVTQTQGSVPREAGTWMAVMPQELIGTIGGGHLELDAIARARAMLAGTDALPAQAQRYALGPSLGQCCGGVVHLAFERVSKADIPNLLRRLSEHHLRITLFGGGHVGHALIRLLGSLPFAVSWIDSRDEIFPKNVPGNVQCEHSDPVQAAVQHIVAGSRVLIMSFSHAEDLEILAQCLLRAREKKDLPYIGLIGSKTKWATFRHRLSERGFDEIDFAKVTCPIGLPGIEGKAPEIIALAVAAQLLNSNTAKN